MDSSPGSRLNEPDWPLHRVWIVTKPMPGQLPSVSCVCMQNNLGSALREKNARHALLALSVVDGTSG